VIEYRKQEIVEKNIKNQNVKKAKRQIKNQIVTKEQGGKEK
jgi:hypothetical protein